ncbi:protein PEP-RELATED DEVELOPMENT ARRESTED 1, chloroplastic [Sesamum angolense]|uniref:Protein PEP-RELATED DEVELOPMENT ARRESTED 1, chloroplastic n=1 Tax=Sesamum angolense TaxID=2727404 RepID=A0AAE2C3C0_9LAMI|nr:protein PEP-RELATED DEVELOPMENT ARRESTED 1, chloroplastic [Sesamum angolense]
MASAPAPPITFSSASLSNSNSSIFLRPPYPFHLKHLLKRAKFRAICSAHVAPSEGYSMNDFFANEDVIGNGTGGKKWDAAQYEALLKGGEQVTSVLEEMAKLLEDMNMDEASEEVAVQLAAQGVIGKRVDQMESGFMMALDYMTTC